jgi:hypothetical protein
LDAFADRLFCEASCKLPVNEAALFEADVAVDAALLVAFVADPPLAAWVLLAAFPTVPEVLPPLDEVLFDAELPVVPALPPVAAAAVFAVEPVASVPLLLLALFAEASNAAAADLLSLADSAAFVAKELAVALDLVLLLAAETDVLSEELLLALACCALFLLVLKLAVSLLVFALSSVKDLLSVVLWLSDVVRLDAELSDAVTSELLLTLSWLLAPRL